MTDTERHAANDSDLLPRKMINLKQILAIVPFSRSTLYREMEDGRFPKAREIAPRRIAWYQDDVTAWQLAIDQKVS